MMVPINVGDIVWKKICVNGKLVDNCEYGCCPEYDESYAVAKLEVVESGFIAAANSNFYRKGRVRAAKVLEIKGVITCNEYTGGYSYNDKDFQYVVGEIVKPELDFDTDVFRICTSGIHCFLTEEEARNYDFT